MKNNKAFKIGFLIADLVLLLVGIALIPINLLVINFPEWIPAVFAALSVAGIIAYLIIFETKLVTKIVLPIIIVLASAVSALFPYIYPYWSSATFSGTRLNFDDVITYEEAIEDLDFAMHYLQKVHPMFLHGLTEEIKQGYEASVERLKNDDTITVNDLRREIQSIINPMHDAHTHTAERSYPNERLLKDFPKKRYEGYSFISVNGITDDEAIEIARPYTSYESEDGISINWGFLSTYGFYQISAPYTFVWADKNGNTITEVYTEEDFVSPSEYNEIYSEYFPQTEEEPLDFVYYEIDEERSLAVLTLTSCIYNQTYIDCVREMFTEVKEKGVQNVAVDVRSNSGGNSRVADEFIKYLPIDNYYSSSSDFRLGFFTLHFPGDAKNEQQTDLLFNGNVYVLTNMNSFSSATDFAMLIQDNGLGKVIGETSKNAVNGYTDIATFYLPNTGIPMSISLKKCYRANPDIKDDFIIPDYQCDSSEIFETLYSLL